MVSKKSLTTSICKRIDPFFDLYSGQLTNANDDDDVKFKGLQTMGQTSASTAMIRWSPGLGLNRFLYYHLLNEEDLRENIDLTEKD